MLLCQAVTLKLPIFQQVWCICSPQFSSLMKIRTLVGEKKNKQTTILPAAYLAGVGTSSSVASFVTIAARQFYEL